MRRQEDVAIAETEVAWTVERAYQLILGRSPDSEGASHFTNALLEARISLDDFYVSLVTSEEFSKRMGPRGQSRHSDQREVVPENVIDVRRLIASMCVDEHNMRAEEYFRTHAGEIDHLLAMPFCNLDESPAQLSIAAELLLATQPLPDMRVLDFGAGACWMTRILCQMHCDVVACDASKTALEIGRELFANLPPIGETRPPHFLHFDGHRIDLPDSSIERIVCIDAFHHVPNQAEILREWHRILEDGGIAAMVEPGPRHSLSPQSQHEMRHYGVIENDILISEIEPMAKEAGFTEVMLALPPAPPILFPPQDYLNVTATGLLPESVIAHIRDIAANHYKIVLFKGQQKPTDSRVRRGLACELEVVLDSSAIRQGELITGHYVARNSGSNTWLHSTASLGQVSLSVHVSLPDGTALEYFLIPITRDRPTSPGEVIKGTFAAEPPKRGSYELRFDLVSEGVSWFATNGSKPVDLRISVE